MLDVTDTMNVSILEKYLTRYYYVKLALDRFESSIYYNTMLYDIFSVIPKENISEIESINEFSDYVTIISDASNKIDFDDESIGVIYIDTKANIEDAIIIARLPTLHIISSEKRKELIHSSNLKNYYRPFWEYYRKDKPTELTEKRENGKNLANAKILVEKGITKYCEENNIDRSDINSLQTFVDYIIGDIFKYKLTVPEEQLLREEVANPSQYPETLLKLMIKMGLLK